jgi:hypothetical protein
MRQVATLDIVEELRLRRWARENYVALSGRSSDWHPVILEEMQRRDAEVERMTGPAILPPKFSIHRRLDPMYGPHELRPHYELDAVASR